MRALNAVRRILLLLLLIPVVAITLNALFIAFGAQRQNPIVKFVRDVAQFFILDPFRTVFPDQSYLVTALVSLAAYGLLALLIIFVFKGLSSMVSTRPPTARPAASAPTAPTAPAAPKRPPVETAGDDTKTDASTSAPTATEADKDSQSTSG